MLQPLMKMRVLFITEDVEDSESSQSTLASSQWVYSPPPFRGKIQPGKRHYKESYTEEKLEIIEKPETKMRMKCFVSLLLPH